MWFHLVHYHNFILYFFIIPQCCIFLKYRSGVCELNESAHISINKGLFSNPCVGFGTLFLCVVTHVSELHAAFYMSLHVPAAAE